jgi:hypothetical protein
MVVNFKARGISRGTGKLARTSTLIKTKKPCFKPSFPIFRKKMSKLRDINKKKKKESFFVMNFLYQDVLIELKLKYFASHLFYHCNSIINKHSYQMGLKNSNLI